MASEMTACNPFALFNPRRLDLVVKWRLFRYWLNGEYPQAEQEYIWHIDQRAGAQIPTGVYVPKAAQLFESMRDNGFNPQYAVPINKQGIILDGAHRTACAAALSLMLPIQEIDTEHQWPDWGESWFLTHGMKVELPGILDDFKRLTENSNG